MRDFLPAEKARRERALGVIRDAYRRHGFDEIETPVMEDASRLHAGLGGDNEKLAFGVLKRGMSPADVERIGGSGDLEHLADLGLRFDLTVPLARFVATHRAELPPVFRAIQIAPVWRAERPQKGRYRQFVQCDIDIVGEASWLAEAELVAATVDALDALGVAGCSVRMNDRRLLVAMLDAFGFPDASGESVLVTIDKLDKVGPAGVTAELEAKGMPPAAVAALGDFLARDEPPQQDFGAEAVRSALPAAVAGSAADAIDDLAAIGAAVASARASTGAAATPVVFDPFLVRGMGYYTGTIFEVAHPELGYSLGGGGRYDGMIGRFTGTDVPAAGFSLGFERIVDLLGLDDPEAGESIVLVHDRDADPADLLTLKSALVATGVRVRLESRTKNLKALLERAAEAGYRTFAQVGDGRVAPADLDRRPLG